MKISKIIFTLAVIFVITPATIFAQTEKLDIIEYTPPSGWNKTPKQGVMIYTNSNTGNGTFCIISVYPSVATAGSPRKDFTNEWNAIVVKPFKADANPKTETQTADGWTSVSGAAQIESDGVRSAVLMTVVSGYGRTASIFAIFNDEAYVARIDAFLTGIKMDKLAARATANPPTSVPAMGKNEDYLDFDPFPGMPGFQPPKPLLGRLRKTITMADLVGKWQLGGASVTSYFNSVSGGYSSTDTSFFGQWYTISADGRYESQLQGRTSNHTVRETDSGTIILDGGLITIRSAKNPAMRNQFVAYMEQPDGSAVLSLRYTGDETPLTAEQLRGNCNHTQGFISCMGGNEWVRLPK